MEVYKKSVRRMTGEELVKLAVALKLPLTKHRMETGTLRELVESELDRLSKKEQKGTRQALNNPAIGISGLVKRYGKKVAVNGLNMEVRPGEIVGLVGPNGAGKSTTLRVITGIIQANSGLVYVDGHSITSEPLLAKYRIGYIPERPTCYASLRVREYLTFTARIYGVPKHEALIRMSEYIDFFQLGEFSKTYIGNLSKGNLQRTLLAAIFVREPPFVLAYDEPMYGLDPRGAWSLKVLLRKLKSEGSAVLISTHILEMAESLCDRFVVIDNGSVVGEGTLEQLKAQVSGADSLEQVFLKLTGGIPEE